MLAEYPALFPHSDPPQVVPRQRRRIIELYTETEGRVLHIVENGVAPASVRAFAETAAITGAPNVFACGTSGTWTLTPAGWRLTVKASIGDLLLWSPNVLLQGAPAAFDVASVADGAAVRWKSSGTITPASLGSIYTQGDYGTARLTDQYWRVAGQDIVNGLVTLALGYRAGGGMALGHADGVSRLSLTNHGPVDA